MLAQLVSTHGLPNHITFTNIPKYCPINGTTNMSYYKIGQNLLSLLQPLTINNSSLIESFDLISKIKSVPYEILEE